MNYIPFVKNPVSSRVTLCIFYDYASPASPTWEMLREATAPTPALKKPTARISCFSPLTTATNVGRAFIFFHGLLSNSLHIFSLSFLLSVCLALPFLFHSSPCCLSFPTLFFLLPIIIFTVHLYDISWASVPL